jgi:hypothetical protein
MRRISRPVPPAAACALAITLAAGLAAGLAACGDNGEPSGTQGPATIAGGCATDSAVVRSARVLSRADLDGDGHADTVSLTAARGQCGNTLVAHVGGRFASLPLRSARLTPTSVTLVKVPGRRGLLVAARESHPRGGFQLHLFAYAGHHLAELTTPSGAPIVPFVSSDTDPTPLSTSCGRGTVVVDQGVPHEPPGIAFAWDIHRTVYTVSGARVSGARGRELAASVLPALLPKRFPDLAHHVFFRDCAAASPGSGTVAP